MKKFVVCCVGIVVILLTLRTLFNSTFFPIHDFTHVTRLVEMDAALKDGQFPVRWVRDLGYGYGMPLFSFYGPMPYYVAELFHGIGFSALASIKLMLIALSATAFFGMFALASTYFGTIGGLIAATAFLTMPYRAVDIFVRGSFNEIFAISFIPLILYGFVKISKDNSWKWVAITSLSTMFFFTSHNLMSLMFLPLLYVFAWMNVFQPNTHNVLYILKFHLSLLLSFGLSAFYLFPSFFEKDLTQVNKLIGGYGQYKQHFLYIRQLFVEHWGYGASIVGIEDGLSFHLGWTHLLLGILGGVAWFMYTKKKLDRRLILFLLVSLIGALFLTTYKSQFIWESIPFMAYFQFPWRFLSVSLVVLSLFTGAVVYAIPNHVFRYFASIVVIALLLVMNLRFFQPSALMEDKDALYYEDPTRIQSTMSDVLPDYIPIGMSVMQAPFQQQYEVQGNVDQKVEVLVDRTHERLLRFQLTTPGTLIARITWFPNWTAYDNGNKIEVQIDPISGFMLIPLSAGDHTLSLIFEDSSLRMLMNVVTFISFLVALAMIVGHEHHPSVKKAEV